MDTSATSAVPPVSATSSRKKLQLKPLPTKVVNQLLGKIDEHSQMPFSTTINELPNNSQLQRKSSRNLNPLSPAPAPAQSPAQSRNPFSGLTIIRNRSSAKPNSPPQHMLPPPKYIEPIFELPKDSDKRLTKNIINGLNILIKAYASLIQKINDNKAVNIFSFTKILNKILSKTILFQSYLPDIIRKVDQLKEYIWNLMNYIVVNYPEYRSEYTEFNKLKFNDISEKMANYDELLTHISKDFVFKFNNDKRVLVKEEGKKDVKEEGKEDVKEEGKEEGKEQVNLSIDTNVIYDELYNIMHYVFDSLTKLLKLKEGDIGFYADLPYLPDELYYTEYCLTWLNKYRNFINIYIPSKLRVKNIINKNNLSASSISDIKINNETARHKNTFFPVIYYDIIERDLIIDRLDYINMKMNELKKKKSDVSPLLQIQNLLILIKALLRIKYYTNYNGMRRLINEHTRKDIRVSIKKFEVKLKNKDHINEMNMNKAMNPNEIVKLDLVKELYWIVYIMNHYYGKKGFLFRANQVRKFFTRQEEYYDFAHNIHDLNNKFKNNAMEREINRYEREKEREREREEKEIKKREKGAR